MEEKNKKKILLGITIVIIIVAILSIILSKQKSNNKYSDTPQNMEASKNFNEIEEEEIETNEEKINKLKKKTEAERIKAYLGSYFKYIEKKDYDSAYDLLYPEFKQSYFPAIGDYKKYIEEQDFPDLMTIDYDEITTQGELYIVTVRIGNMTARSETQKVEKSFMIKENNYNDYFISFKK